ncbi:helix-turn-helix domain-containing protein [Enterococcus sp. BWB1-3]|uniref:helix-turn-helix domain-containing protein n=1 Tax=Enterococcus sp. BWB1-3 TaxID=2787713 RepID=UPI001921148F|nr:helix-turn-helix transcriptional regulator [Enterococcus sp. BWB1-3]MBL1231001.1 helix-turn-helix domain-containing protein [Enterococcus sp. BWB1-3]
MSNHIGKNIVAIRKKKNISQKELAKTIGITAQGLLKIEKGLVDPKTETLEKIMQALDISANELYGNEETSDFHIQLPFARNLKRIRTEEQLSLDELALKTGISVTQLSGLEEGSQRPSPQLLEKIADALSVSSNELMENDLITKSIIEVELEQFLQYSQYVIQSALKTKNQGEHINVEEYNPETGTHYTKILTNDEQAKNILLKEFNRFSFNELLELYNYYSAKQIMKKYTPPAE